MFIFYFYFFSRLIKVFNSKSNFNKVISKITSSINLIFVIILISISFYGLYQYIFVNPKENPTHKYIDNNELTIYQEDSEVTIDYNDEPAGLNMFKDFSDSPYKMIFYSISIFIFLINPLLASFNFSRNYYSQQKLLLIKVIQNFFLFQMLPFTFWFVLPRINKLIYEYERVNNK